MSLRIQTNVEAFRAYRHLDATQKQVGQSMEKLSSGFRINKASDDAAGLAISERLKAQVNGLDQASRNVADGVSMVQTAEGALDQVHAMLQRVRELAVKYNNDTLADTDRAAITAEVAQLCNEISRIGNDTEFNGISLLTGTSSSYNIQVGANDSQTISVTVDQIFGAGAKVDPGALDFGATSATIASIDEAIQAVADKRGEWGAVQNRLDYTAAQLSIYKENLTDSLSRIRDVDMAAEMVKFTKSQILQQAGTAMLAQANQTPSSVLQLLR